MGYDPTNVKEAELLVKKKNEDISSLRKQIKLPQSEHPQTKEIIEGKNEKYDMMNMIFHLIAQIK